MNGLCFGSNVIPIQRNGHCLVRAIPNCMHNTENRHSEIRIRLVNKIISELEYYRDLLWIYQWFIRRAEDYKNSLSRDGEYGGSVELICISRLFSIYLFRVHNKSNTNILDYGCINYVLY